MRPEAVVRRLFERLAERDTDGISKLLHPDVVWLGTLGGLDANRVLRGPDAFFDYLEEIEQPWQRLEADVERLIESGETVVAFLHETARGREGLDLHSDTAMVFKVRAGRIAEVRGYLDRDEALDAVALEE